jgi:hypothetical protein
LKDVLETFDRRHRNLLDIFEAPAGTRSRGQLAIHHGIRRDSVVDTRFLPHW